MRLIIVIIIIIVLVIIIIIKTERWPEHPSAGKMTSPGSFLAGHTHAGTLL